MSGNKKFGGSTTTEERKSKIEKTSVWINLTRSGNGIKIKLPEALPAGTILVGSREGLEALLAGSRTGVNLGKLVLESD